MTKLIQNCENGLISNLTEWTKFSLPLIVVPLMVKVNYLSLTILIILIIIIFLFLSYKIRYIVLFNLIILFYFTTYVQFLFLKELHRINLIFKKYFGNDKNYK